VADAGFLFLKGAPKVDIRFLDYRGWRRHFVCAPAHRISERKAEATLSLILFAQLVLPEVEVRTTNSRRPMSNVERKPGKATFKKGRKMGQESLTGLLLLKQGKVRDIYDLGDHLLSGETLKTNSTYL